MVAVQEGSLSSAVALDDSGAVRTRPPVEQLAALATDGIEQALNVPRSAQCAVGGETKR